jgi:DUF4097 and DUF4098 domain-containing protein YvlB
VTFVELARQTGMNTETAMNPATPRPSSRGWIVLWTLLIATFLLVSLAWPARADRLTANASRTDTFGAVAGAKSLSIDGVSGDVEVTPGPSFGASVKVTVKADDEARAKEILGKTKISFENRGGELSLATLEPGATFSRDGRRSRLRVSGNGSRRWRVEARYRVTLPPGANLAVSLVNGGVKTSRLDGVQELTTVNGRIVATEARRDVELRSVNGSVEGSLTALPRGAKVSAETVTGSVTLTLPADAAFDLKASSINGGIRSTFPLPVSDAGAGDEDVARAVEKAARAEAGRARAAASADRARAKAERHRDRGRELDDEWDREWQEFGREMASFGREMARLSREISRSVTGSLNRSYVGSVKGGGATVKCSTVNGAVLVLAAGTADSEAKSLVPRKSSTWVGRGVPPVPPVPHVPPVPPVPPIPPIPELHGLPGHRAGEGSIVKGDVTGDFKAALPTGDVRLGNVSGNVTVRTSSGDVRVVSAGKGADLSSSGGDVRIERVTGGLTASSLGGDIVVGDVSGEARLRTMGGDIRLRSSNGPVTAKTAGGDVRLLRVGGSVRAETAGGEVYCEIVSRESGAVDLSTGGGDVTLVLPSNFRADVEVNVRGVDADGDYVISEFPEIGILRKGGSTYGDVRAEGKLGGGGPKVTINVASGTVHVRKGPPV